MVFTFSGIWLLLCELVNKATVADLLGVWEDSPNLVRDMRART